MPMGRFCMSNRLRRAIACAAVALVAASEACAADTEASNDEDADKRVFLCSPSESRFLIVYPSDERARDKTFAESRMLEIGSLTNWESDPSTDANAKRAPSGTAQYRCGRFSLTLTTGFFN